MFFNRSFVPGFLALALCVPAAHAQLETQTIRPKSGAKSNRPAQAKLAHKGAFATIAATDAAVKSALSATDLAKARAGVNRSVKVVGTVVKVYAPKSNARVLLNFAANYKTAVVGMIDAKNFKQFPDLHALAGKRVLMSGHAIAFKDQIELDLSAPNSIRIVK